LIAVAALGESSDVMRVLAALLGGSVAASSHLTKAGTRALANTSPEPFSNWLLSLGEDGFVIALGILTLHHPIVALVVVIALLVLIAMFARLLVRGVRRILSVRSG
jgi:hypothetical protein